MGGGALTAPRQGQRFPRNLTGTIQDSADRDSCNDGRGIRTNVRPPPARVAKPSWAYIAATLGVGRGTFAAKPIGLIHDKNAALI
jgi:hypothetical protein